MKDESTASKIGQEVLSSSNHLLSEKSPYLLQHAHNPVHWYPWGEDAFRAAAEKDKPIFLSIGYSTCHWCHVMAHESFEDPEVAALMNRAFVCIKVDREERPDIDQIYMGFAQAMTSRGGWPLTIIMTPDKKPFFAATYIPKSSSRGQAGMMEIIPKVQELWEKNREQLLDSADKIIDFIRGQSLPPAGADAVSLNETALDRGYEALSSIYDPQNGGFGTAPKFPSPHNLFFLLRYWHRTGDQHALQMIEETLRAMRQGGIYDHVGFGFHRYSTDAQWLVPHFEKMLYDQALMAIACTETFQATGKEEYGKTAAEILDYVLRDMTAPQGGFLSAEDADSEGEEGKFYLWTAQELKESLDSEDFRLLIRLFDVHESGNFERGGNILRLRSSPEDAATVLKMSLSDLSERMERLRTGLFLARERRVHPLKDDKILTDWNGLMIAALARAAQALSGLSGAKAEEYERAAIKAADFILQEMTTADGRLLHRYRDGAGITANLDDYAFLIWGLLDLYETVFDAKYLKRALELNEAMIEHFWDKDEDQNKDRDKDKDRGQGGLFFSPDDGEDLLLRKKEYYDGAIPSGNSIAMHNLLRLMHLSGRTNLEEMAWKLARSALWTSGFGQSMLLCSLDYAIGPTSEVALLGSREDARIAEMLRAMRSRFLPNKSTLLVHGEMIREIVPFSRSLPQDEGTAAAYVCTDHVCSLPVPGPKELMLLLEGNSRKTH